MTKPHTRWLALAAFTLFAISGCSISYSLTQSSDSLTNSSDSISGSFTSSTSSGGDTAAALGHFLDDVSGLAAAWTNSSRESAERSEFEHELGSLALSYGIVDWESVSRVYYAIGQGVRQAGSGRHAVGDQPFLQSGLMKKNSSLISSGYRGVSS